MARKRRHHKRSNPPRRHRRRSNPGRHYNGRRRRRNPGLGGPVKSVVRALIPSAAGGFGAGLLDAKIAGNWPMPLRIFTKLLAAGLGGAVLRRNPISAAAFMGSMIGSAGYEGGVRLGGGVIATSKGQGMRELAAMAAEDEESLGLLTEELHGMGLLTEMGDDDDMSEIEPDLGDNEPDLGDEEEIGDDDD